MLVELVPLVVGFARVAARVAPTAATPSRSPRAVRQLRDEGRDVWAWSPRWGGDAHAGRIETSLMLALAPELRRPERAAGQHRAARRAAAALRARACARSAPNGVLGDPAGASAEEGRALLAAAIADLVALSLVRTAEPATGAGGRSAARRRRAASTRPRVRRPRSRTRLAAAALARPPAARGTRRRARHRGRARDRRRDRARGSPPTAGTSSRSTAPRTTRGCPTRSAPSAELRALGRASACVADRRRRHATPRRSARRSRPPSGAGAGSTRSSPPRA